MSKLSSMSPTHTHRMAAVTAWMCGSDWTGGPPPPPHILGCHNGSLNNSKVSVELRGAQHFANAPSPLS